MATRLDVLWVVALGGAVGTAARAEITRVDPVVMGHFPVPTFLINTSGSFVLGFLLVLLVERLRPSRYARAFLGVGVLGAYTTFATFAVEAVQLERAHRPALAVSFVGASILGGLLAAWAGAVAGRAVPHRHPHAPRHPREDAT